MSEFLPNFTFKPFTGVIEQADDDDTDPLKLGRVRVRVHGYHNSDTDHVPTDSLPWAHVTYNDSKRMSVPTNGEWVIGFFLDGEEAQKPIIIGTLPGINDVEPSTSKWARNDDGDTDVSSATQYEKKKEGAQYKGTDIEEPYNEYEAVYPHNKVIETTSGHLIEIDDTPDKERIHIYHKSGSFSEFHASGDKVDKTEGDKYTITLGNDYLAVTGDGKIEGDSSSKSFKITKFGTGSELSIDDNLLFENPAGGALKVSNIGLLSYKNNATNLKSLIDDIATLLQKLTTNLLVLDVVTPVGPGIAGPGIITNMTTRLIEVLELQVKIATLLE